MDSDLDRTHVALHLALKQGQLIVCAAVFRKDMAVVEQLADGPLEERSRYLLQVFEFLDNHQLSSLDSLMQQVGNREVQFVISEEFSGQGASSVDISKAHVKKVNALFEARSVVPVVVKKHFFTRKSDTLALIQCKNRSVEHVVHQVDSERSQAIGCVECVWQLVNIRDKLSANREQLEISVELGILEKHMRLDGAAAEAVHLLPRADQPSQFGSLFGVLNRCKTKLGSRTLERWLRQPLLSVEEIKARHDIVQLLVLETVSRDKLRDGPLKSMPDVETISNKMRKRTAGLAELIRLRQFALAMPEIVGILQELSQGQSDDDDLQRFQLALQQMFTIPITKIAGKFSQLQQLVEAVVDLSALPELRVNPQHDSSLQELSKERDGLELRAQKMLQDARLSWAAGLDVKLERHSMHGLIFRSTKGEDERRLRDNNSSVKILSILKTGCYFTTVPLERVSERMSSIDHEYAEQQTLIVQQAMDVAVTYVPLLESVGALLSALDVLASFAVVVSCSPAGYCRPTMLNENESRELTIIGARHPCVELMDNVCFLPNNYELNEHASLHLITGPNMGGKSTYIRALGCCAVLAQVGMFVPATSARMSIVDSVLARVGAGDSAQKGISTFLAEMQESAVILNTASKNSLLIVDELGRGTSTHDGFGLAWAICDHIVKEIDCFCVFATHFHELTALAEKHPQKVVNQHVGAVVENDELRMLYQLQQGPCTQSFGIHVAKTAGFPREVICEAQRKADILEKHAHFEVDSSRIEEGRTKRRKVEETLKKFGSTNIPSLCSQEIKATLQELFPKEALENIA